MPTIIVQHATSDDEVAAVIAAVSALLAEEAQANSTVEVAKRPAWRAAALVEAQGQITAYSATYAGWGQAERTQRARRWSKGIVGS